MFWLWFLSEMDPDDPFVKIFAAVIGIAMGVGIILGIFFSIKSCAHEKKKINTELMKPVIQRTTPAYDTIYNNDSVLILKKR